MKNGKSPGSDGLTVEFYKTFWPVISEHVLNCFKEIDDEKSLGFSQRQGIIKLLPKKDRNPHFVENHRPITLLNVDYKLFTGTLAYRMKEILPRIVHVDQKGFVAGRYLGENLVDIYSLIENIGNCEFDSYALVSLDIRKAFDTVSWSFLKTMLLAFGFPDRFVRWVEYTTKNKSVKILNNGYYSRELNIQRGVPQGDGLSPALFILVMEALANTIRNNEDIKGVELRDLDPPVEKKISLVADDTLLSVRGDTGHFI